MKISIIIPVYNVEPYVEDCLSSIATQTYKGEIECIIVNDCTPDNSCEVIERFMNGYSGDIDFKLVHHTRNRGLSAARNTGIDTATGDYIYFLDSDDEITPNAIELLVAPLEQHKYDFVIGDYTTIGSDIKFPPLYLEQGAIMSNTEISKQFLREQWYVMAVNKLCNLDYMRREKLYFKEGLTNEDELWSFQLAYTAQSMYVVKEKTYLYKVRETSIMGKLQLAKKISSLATITHEAYEWSKERNILVTKDAVNQILYYRNIVLKNIFKMPSFKEKKEIYLQCYERIRISALKLCRKGLLEKKSIVRELYNYLPGSLGFWHLYIYKILFRSRI